MYEISQPRDTYESQASDSSVGENQLKSYIYDGKDFLSTMDYFSNYWEINRLKNIKLSTIIRKLKTHLNSTKQILNHIGEELYKFKNIWSDIPFSYLREKFSFTLVVAAVSEISCDRCGKSV